MLIQGIDFYKKNLHHVNDEGFFFLTPSTQGTQGTLSTSS